MGTVSEMLSIAFAHHRAGRLQAAEQCYRQVVQTDPSHADATHLLGVLASQAGNHALAAEHLERAAVLKPDQPNFHNNLGVTYVALGRLAEAITRFQEALQLDPRLADGHFNLGHALHDRGDVLEAVACYQKTIELDPSHWDAHFNLGRAQYELGHGAEAINSFRRAFELDPGNAQAHFRLGNALADREQFTEAIASYRRSIDLAPNHGATAANNLGIVMVKLGQYSEAVDCYRLAVQINPKFAMAYVNWGSAVLNQGYADEAISCYRQAMEQEHDLEPALSSLLQTLQYCDGTTPGQLVEAHREYQQQYASPLRSCWRSHDNDRDPDRPLRLGFVSADFFQHPVGFFLVRVLENLDRDHCETFCYSGRLKRDEYTERFQATAAAWRDVRRQDDALLAEQIRADRIDILFDLSGFTADNRLLVFARKPSPIQITWLGYEGTTGLEAMDYLLADRHVIPYGEEPFYREQVVRMPDGYVCYDPSASAPPVGPLPALANGHITFGSYSNLAKISPGLLAVWSQILHRLPNSRLILKYKGFYDPSTKQRYLEWFASEGIGPHRLSFLKKTPLSDYLAAYGQLDIALDTFPFSGSATTCDALWMGVPVVTCPGPTFAGRHSLSHLSNIGLPELIARDKNEYIERAVALAGDLPGLASMRAGLRQRMAVSPLCDGKRFADKFVSLLRDLWRQYCGKARATEP